MNPQEPRYGVGQVLSLIRHSTPVCRVLALTSALVWLSVAYVGAVWNLDDAVGLAVANNPAIWLGQTYRLATAPFVHDGLIHLCFVLMNLLFFGPLVEDLIGTARFGLLCAWAVGLSLIGSVALDSTPTCGLSPVDMALFGVLGVAFSLRRDLFDPLVRSSLAFALLMAVFLIGALPLTDVRVNAAFHLVGLVAGVMAAPLLIPLPWPLPTGARLAMLSSMTVIASFLLLSSADPPEKDPQMAEYYVHKGLQAYDAGNEAATTRAFTRAVEYLHREGVSSELTQREAGLLYNLGVLADHAGELDAATNWFRRSVEADHDFMDGWEALVQVALDLRQGEQALAWLRELERLRPLDATVQLYRADAYEDLARWDDAEASIQKALSLKGAEPQAWQAEGALNLRLGRLDEARSALQKAQAMTTNTVPILRLLAQVELAAHRPEAAQSAIEAGLKVNSTDVPLLLLEGQWYEGHLQPADARRFYARARSASPGDAQVLLYLADYYRGQANPFAARRCLEIMLRGPVQGQDDLLAHAQGLLWLDRPDEAQKLCDRALKNDPQDGGACYLAGLLQEKSDRGVQWLRQAVTLLPFESSGWFELGQVTVTANPARARACMERTRALARSVREEMLADGYLALLDGDDQTASKKADQVLSSLPSDSDALRLAVAASQDATETARLRDRLGQVAPWLVQ